MTFEHQKRRHAGISVRASSSCRSNQSQIACNGVAGWLAIDICVGLARWNWTTLSNGGMHGHGFPSASQKTQRSAIFLASSGDWFAKAP
ncbi:hypothetical protein ACVSQB_39610 [Bradyrhizobium elkanii]